LFSLCSSLVVPKLDGTPRPDARDDRAANCLGDRGAFAEREDRDRDWHAGVRVLIVEWRDEPQLGEVEASRSEVVIMRVVLAFRWAFRVGYSRCCLGGVDAVGGGRLRSLGCGRFCGRGRGVGRVGSGLIVSRRESVLVWFALGEGEAVGLTSMTERSWLLGGFRWVVDHGDLRFREFGDVSLPAPAVPVTPVAADPTRPHPRFAW